MNRKISAILITGALMSAGSAHAFKNPVTIEAQGSFTAGGSTITRSGDFSNPLSEAGQTIHGDHAYVFWQKPVNARKFPLVFLHGAASSGQVWETTPDGRDGYQNIFLERGYSTYIIDQPRRGRAGKRRSLQSRRLSTLGDLAYGLRRSRMFRSRLTLRHGSSISGTVRRTRELLTLA